MSLNVGLHGVTKIEASEVQSCKVHPEDKPFYFRKVTIKHGVDLEFNFTLFGKTSDDLTVCDLEMDKFLHELDDAL